MTNVSLVKNNYKIELDELNAMTLEAAQVVREGMEKAGVEEYQHFLDTMYHYTRYSEDNLKIAAAQSQTAELKEYFEHMAKDERGHYRMAKCDLEGYGKEVSVDTPYVVSVINTMWVDLKTSQSGNGYLGMLYVFENVAQHLGEEVRGFLARLETTKKQSRWLSVHAEVDLSHGQEAEEMVLKYIDDNPALLMESARKATSLWIELMLYAFKLSGQEVKKAS